MSYFDNFGNRATITKKRVLPYKGATKKQNAYVLKIQSLYDKNFIYFLSVYETEEEATQKLRAFSCGTFKKGAKYGNTI